MKVLLVRPKYSSIVANLEPLGLEYIIGLCNELKIDSEILDEFQYSYLFRLHRMKKLIKNGNYNFIGFTANANTVDIIKKRAKQLKKIFPSIKIMVGGPEAELNYKEFYTEDIDLIYHDNGLQTLKNILEMRLNINELKKQTGICYKINNKWIYKKKGEPINNFIVKPDRTAFYNGLKKNFIFMKGKYALMKASFSCPFNCNFCYCTKMNSGIYKERCLDDVIEEIKSIKHDKIWFVDDTFFYNKNRVKMFCEKIIAEGIDKQFMAYSRADFLAKNPDILPLVYKAGFRDILVGLEAISDNQLNDYNKRTTINDNIEAIKNLHNNNIVCNGLFVINHNFTRNDFKKLLKFIKENNLLWVVFSIFTPYNGTDSYKQYKDELYKFKSKRLDELHITIKPKKMSSLMFMFRFYLLHVLTYPKIIVRTILKTSYMTKKY